MSTKSIGYSYPTSPNAERFGAPDGCWVVQIIDRKRNGEPKPPRAISAHPTERAALEVAAGRPEPWQFQEQATQAAGL